MIIKSLSNVLDRNNFLGIRIWDFGLRSLSREYSWLFLFKVIFKYPVKTFKGLLSYRKFCNSIGQLQPEQIYTNAAIDEFISQANHAPGSFLVAMGYCQRPLNTGKQPFNCPSQRFSHSCYFIENYQRRSQIPPACSLCDIRPIAELTLMAGACFHIMTSAMDIARDIFMPVLAGQRFCQVILFICPFSILPITLPLFIGGVKFIIVPYTTGDCRDYGDFVRADEGRKTRRTFSSKKNYNTIYALLDKIRKQPKENIEIKTEGHLYIV